MNDVGKMREGGLSSTPPPTPNDAAVDASAPSAVADTTSSDHESRSLVDNEMKDDSKHSHWTDQDVEQPDRGAFPTEEEDNMEGEEVPQEVVDSIATNGRTSSLTKMNDDGGPPVIDDTACTVVGEQNDADEDGNRPNSDLINNVGEGPGEPVQPPETVRPVSKDILFGRGKPFQNHPGNRQLIFLVDKYKDQYVKSVRDKKRPIVEEIIGILTQDGARFLKRYNDDSSSPFWIEVSKEVAFDKVSHAFRSRGKSKSSSSRTNEASAARTNDNVNKRNQQNHNSLPPHLGHPPRYGAMLPPTVRFSLTGPAAIAIPGASPGLGIIGAGGMPVGPFFNPWNMNMLMNPTATAAPATVATGGTTGTGSSTERPPYGTAGAAVTPAPGMILPPGISPHPHGMPPPPPPPLHYMQQTTPPQPQLQYYHQQQQGQQQQQQYQPQPMQPFGFVPLPQQVQQPPGQEPLDASFSTANDRPPSPSAATG